MRQQVGTVGRDLYRAIQVGPEDLRPIALEAGDGLGRRVAVIVVHADADNGNARVERLHQRLRRRRAAAVVRHLEHVELRSKARGKAGRQ